MKKWIYAFMVLMMVVAGIGANMVLAGDAETGTEQVIQVNARKFAFAPNMIKLKKGVPVILEFTSADIMMGFNAPDFKSRVTIVPGKTVRVRIVPQDIGEFTFFCDIFCGDGHEDMTGTIVVTA